MWLFTTHLLHTLRTPGWPYHFGFCNLTQQGKLRTDIRIVLQDAEITNLRAALHDAKAETKDLIQQNEEYRKKLEAQQVCFSIVCLLHR